MNKEILYNFLHDSGLKFKIGAKSYIFTCPLCNKKDKLYIRKDDGRFICFHCKETERFFGKPEYALAKLLDKPVQEVQQKLYNFVPSSFEDVITIKFKNALFNDFVNEELIEEEVELLNSLSAVEWPPEFINISSNAASDAKRYLEFRGIPQELVSKYQICYNPSEHRVILPVIVNDQLLGWQGRYIYNNALFPDKTVYSGPKILTSQGLSGGKYLMFQDNLLTSYQAVLAEGPFDALKLELCKGNVASMGKGITRPQIETVLDYLPSKIYLALDPDAATDVERVCKLIHELTDNKVPVYYMTPPKGKEDFGECSLEESLEQYHKAELISLPKIFLYFKG